MLQILDVKELDGKKLKIKKVKTNKKQILLLDTYRRHGDYINKIIYRKNGKFSELPNFLITKTGEIFKIFDPIYSSNMFNNKKLDNKQIKIVLENLGYLTKDPITGIYHNWIGDPFRTEPYIKKWRNHFYWDPYTEEQYSSLKMLCDILCDNFGIEKNVVKNQNFFSDSVNFNGILCKSNFSTIYSDINPSFNFEKLL